MSYNLTTVRGNLKRHIILLAFICLTSVLAWGQTNKTSDIRFEPTIGTFIFSNSMAQEILPHHGLRISKSVHSFRPEVTIFHGRAKGILYYNALLSIMNTLELEGLEPFYYLGLNLNQIKRESPPADAFPWQNRTGWHMGFGTYYPISKYFALRADIILYKRPGKAVYVGGGFSFRIPFDEGGGSGGGGGGGAVPAPF